jgi:hypothetical protein
MTRRYLRGPTAPAAPVPRTLGGSHATRWATGREGLTRLAADIASLAAEAPVRSPSEASCHPTVTWLARSNEAHGHLARRNPEPHAGLRLRGYPPARLAGVLGLRRNALRSRASGAFLRRIAICSLRRGRSPFAGRCGPGHSVVPRPLRLPGSGRAAAFAEPLHRRLHILRGLGPRAVHACHAVPAVGFPGASSAHCRSSRAPARAFGAIEPRAVPTYRPSGHKRSGGLTRACSGLASLAADAGG